MTLIETAHHANARDLSLPLSLEQIGVRARSTSWSVALYISNQSGAMWH